MKNPIVICGYGPGISQAVARRFGAAGHPVAIIARNAERLEVGAEALRKEGVTAKSFPADLTDSDARANAFADIRASLGPVGILHWNAFLPVNGDLLSSPVEDLRQSLELRLVSFIAAVQALFDDLKASGGTILATSGITALDRPEINKFAVDYAVMAITVAAQHKALGILVPTLASHGIHVAEVVINGFVKGTEGVGAFDQTGTIDPKDVAACFWDMFENRTQNSRIFGADIIAEEALRRNPQAHGGDYLRGAAEP